MIFRGPVYSLADRNSPKSKERQFRERKVVAAEILDKVLMCKDGYLPLPPTPAPTTGREAVWLNGNTLSPLLAASCQAWNQ